MINFRKIVFNLSLILSFSFVLVSCSEISERLIFSESIGGTRDSALLRWLTKLNKFSIAQEKLENSIQVWIDDAHEIIGYKPEETKNGRDLDDTPAIVKTGGKIGRYASHAASAAKVLSYLGLPGAAPLSDLFKAISYAGSPEKLILQAKNISTKSKEMRKILGEYVSYLKEKTTGLSGEEIEKLRVEMSAINNNLINAHKHIKETCHQVDKMISLISESKSVSDESISFINRYAASVLSKKFQDLAMVSQASIAMQRIIGQVISAKLGHYEDKPAIKHVLDNFKKATRLVGEIENLQAEFTDKIKKQQADLYNDKHK
jgi:hypothetical protein